MVDKITSPITPLGEIDKINEIIDEVDKKLDKSGGNMTGNLSVNNSASITTNGYVVGTWLQTKSASINNDLTTVAMLDGNGWIYKQSKDTLLSGTVKSVNNTSPDSNGNVTISIPPTVTESTVSGWGFTKNAGTVTSVNNVSPVNGNVTLSIPTQASDIGAQPTLVSGTNIKTINNTSLLGSGNIDIQGGGASRNIGEIVASTIPLTDAGLHLLDGALISGSGSYSEFVTYIAGLVSTYPDLFTTESNWQSTVTQYGVCGKFVYNSVNNTVRLPKITGIIEGTTDVSALGDLVEAGLPNITVSGMPSWDSASSSGALEKIGDTAFYSYTTGGSLDSSRFDASRCSSVYGKSNTVQPQTIKILYYIVIATSTKTDIQVDIDEIATDLNGKADVDLSNVPTSRAILEESYVNGTSWYRVYSDGWCEQGGSVVTDSANPCSVTLLKSYANTNYMVWTSQIDTLGNQQNVRTINTKTTSNFTFWSWNVSGINTFWQACGYIR